MAQFMGLPQVVLVTIPVISMPIVLVIIKFMGMDVRAIIRVMGILLLVLELAAKIIGLAHLAVAIKLVIRNPAHAIARAMVINAHVIRHATKKGAFVI